MESNKQDMEKVKKILLSKGIDEKKAHDAAEAIVRAATCLEGNLPIGAKAQA